MSTELHRNNDLTDLVEAMFNPELGTVDAQFDAFFARYRDMFVGMLEPSNFVGITREQFIEHQLKQIARINYMQGRDDQQARKIPVNLREQAG